jgi:hypothetical protein
MTQAERQIPEAVQEQILRRLQKLERVQPAAQNTDVKTVLRTILRDETGRKAAIAFTEILGEPVCRRRQGMNRYR